MHDEIKMTDQTDSEPRLTNQALPPPPRTLQSGGSIVSTPPQAFRRNAGSPNQVHRLMPYIYDRIDLYGARKIFWNCIRCVQYDRGEGMLA